MASVRRLTTNQCLNILMKKKHATEEDTWKDEYKSRHKDVSKHSRRHGKYSPHMNHCKSETNTPTSSSDLIVPMKFPWHHVWFAGILTLTVLFTAVGLGTVILLVTAYTDYCCGLFESCESKINKAKLCLVISYFVIFLLISLASILILLAKYNYITMVRFSNATLWSSTTVPWAK